MNKKRFIFEIQNEDLSEEEIIELRLYFVLEESKINQLSKYKVRMKEADGDD